MTKYVIDVGSPWGLMIQENIYLTAKEMENAAYHTWKPHTFNTRAEAEKWVQEHRETLPSRPYIREWSSKT